MKYSATISSELNVHLPVLSRITRLSLLSFLALLLFACNKESDPSPSGQTALLIAHPWMNQNLTAVVDGKTYTDKSQALTAECTFKPDGSYVEYYPDDKTSSTGTWKLSGSQLTTTLEGVVLNGEITKLTNDELSFSLPEVDVSKLDVNVDFESLEPSHKDYLAYLQLLVLYFGDFTGFDVNSPTKKVQLSFGYVRK